MLPTVVFLDFGLFNDTLGRVKIELQVEEAPVLAELFRKLCTGEQLFDHRPVGYKSCPVSLRLVGGNVLAIESGDFDGRAGKTCISYDPGSTVSSLKHDLPGTVSMLNDGGSKFVIVAVPCPALDGQLQVVGRVVEGAAVLRKVEAILSDRSVPPGSVSVVQSGQMY